ncbi:MAG TPA: hypothetical protein VLU91_02180 [Nitrososphaerales archaeon]|nr:hypothetical protein [Nitrososphaerales archaeon]
MKLTRFGRDYLLAALLLATTALIFGEQLFAALALGMVFTSLVSVVVFRSRGKRVAHVSAEAPKLRVFKRSEARTPLLVPGLLDRWTAVTLGAVSVAESEASVVPLGEGRADLVVKPRRAGRFERIDVTLELHDTLGLFAVRRTVPLSGLVVDSLPLSMLAPPRRVFAPPIVIGEVPAGSAGKGQEFYGIEQYTERSEGRDILWKRAAAAPERPLMARVREANIPDAVRLVVVTGELSEVVAGELVDLECEALGMLGGALLQVGVAVDIVSPDGRHHRATDDDELADSIMEVSACKQASGQGLLSPDGYAIFLAVGPIDYGQVLSMGRNPVVFVGKGSRGVDSFSANFTGVEDLTRIVGLVLSR